MAHIFCKFCDWNREFIPPNRDAVMDATGRHLERYHSADEQSLAAFDLSDIKRLYSLPDNRDKEAA
jgi:hypothetical protein